MEAAFKHIDDRLFTNKYLAGTYLTAVDIMTVCSLSTQRYWVSQADYGPSENMSCWLKNCSSKGTYLRAMEKVDPEMELLLGPERPKIGLMAAGDTTSGHWKKKKENEEGHSIYSFYGRCKLWVSPFDRPSQKLFHR